MSFHLKTLSIVLVLLYLKVCSTVKRVCGILCNNICENGARFLCGMTEDKKRLPLFGETLFSVSDLHVRPDGEMVARGMGTDSVTAEGDLVV